MNRERGDDAGGNPQRGKVIKWFLDEAATDLIAKGREKGRKRQDMKCGDSLPSAPGGT